MKKIIPFSKEIPFKTRIAEIVDIEVSHNLEKTPLNTIEGNFLVNGAYKMTEASQIEESFSYDLPFTIEVDEKYDLSDVKIKISDFFFEIINEDVLKINIEVELTEVKEKAIVPLEDEISRFFETIEEEEQEETVECSVMDVENEVEIKESLAPSEEKDENNSYEDARCYDEENIDNIIPDKEEVSDEMSLHEDTFLEATKEKERPIEELIQADVISPIDILDSEIPKALDISKKSESMKSKEGVSDKPITDIFTSINNDEDSFKAYYVYIVRENDTIEDVLKRYNVTRDEAEQYNDFNDIKIGTKLILPCSSNE